MVRVSSSLMPIRPFPAMLLRKGPRRVLVVADLHIGWEAALAQQGIHVPSQTPKSLDRMLQLVKSCKPTTLILLGDVKHTIAKAEMTEWRDIPDFLEALGKAISDIQVIPGNHDGNLEPLLPQAVKILPFTGVALGDVGLFHGHAWPAPELLGCRNLITGHLHPMIAFRDTLGFQIRRQVWVKARCDGVQLAKSLLKHLNVKLDKGPAALLQDRFNVKLRSSKFFIMPSFNDFLGGQPINKRRVGKTVKSRRFIGPVLRSGSVDIGNAEAYLLDGTLLGAVDQLRSLT